MADVSRFCIKIVCIVQTMCVSENMEDSQCLSMVREEFFPKVILIMSRSSTNDMVGLQSHDSHKSYSLGNWFVPQAH